MSSESHRDTGLDELRGLAVIGMVIAHAIFFFHTGTNPFLQAIERTANTSLFTVFLFIAGAASYISLTTHHHRSSHHLKRLAVLYGSYVIVAIIAILTESHAGGLETIIAKIVKALFLLSPPSFTEYFVPLLIYSVLVILIGKKWLDRMSASLSSVIVIGAAAYVIGTALYAVPVRAYFEPLKALLVGNGRMLVFPVFQYFGVFLFGYFWKHSDDIGHTRSLSRYVSAITVAVVTSASFIITDSYAIPMLDPYNRWPPSISFLSFGLTIAGIGSLLYSEYRPNSSSIFHRICTYFGQDALDIWVTSTILLFGYRVIGLPHTDSVLVVSGLTLILLLVSTSIASLHGRHSHSLFSLVATPQSHGHPHGVRIKKRYALMLMVFVIINAWQLNERKNSPTLGNYMHQQVTTVEQKLPEKAILSLTADRSWVVTGFTDSDPIQLRISLTNKESGSIFPLSSSMHLTITDNGTLITPLCDYQSDGLVTCEIAPNDLPIGVHTIVSTITSGFIMHTSQPITVVSSAPLIISWSFDWEGWDAPDSALDEIETLSTAYIIPFTHFVSPRTFLDGVLSKERRDYILAFLKKRHAMGDELALHLHMHSDFISYAGVHPRFTNQWGYRSSEGYDVPTLEYSEDELSRIFAAAKSLFENSGLPAPVGYRAGGWFADSRVLSIISRFGILYDASGRDRPKTGAFRTIPWNLRPNEQPYIPSVRDQNAPGDPSLPILEIPNNGHSTFETSVEEMITRIKSIYTSGYLRSPTMLSFVSHPQFADKEFQKIAPVLTYLQTISARRGTGPVVYATEETIYHLWTSKR